MKIRACFNVVEDEDDEDEEDEDDEGVEENIGVESRRISEN